MTEPLSKTEEHNEAEEIAIIKSFVAGLSQEHRMLAILKSQLYDNQWEPMLEDLRNRLAGKPYIFKLINRIKDDIARIEEMRAFEQKHKVDLTDYVELTE